MINITETDKYCECQSCGCEKKELLRTFYVGRGNNIKQAIILCIDCIGELVKQGMLYQPKEIEK
jgi:hypothetical protein